ELLGGVAGAARESARPGAGGVQGSGAYDLRAIPGTVEGCRRGCPYLQSCAQRIRKTKINWLQAAEIVPALTCMVVRATVLVLGHPPKQTETSLALGRSGGAGCGYSRRRDREGSHAGSGESATRGRGGREARAGI